MHLSTESIEEKEEGFGERSKAFYLIFLGSFPHEFCAKFQAFFMLSTVLGRFGCSREGILKPHGSFIYDKVQFFLYWTYVMTNWLNRVLDNIINVAGAPYLNEVAATDLDAGHQGDRSVSFASHKNSHFRLKILTVGQPMHHGRFGSKESYWKPFSRIRNQHPCSFNPHHLSLSKPCHIKVKGLSLPKLLRVLRSGGNMV